MCITLFFVHFFCRSCKVKVLKFMFCRGRKHKTTTFFFFPELWHSPLDNSEFTQQDGRKKKTAERLCVTNVTRLFLTCFVCRDLHLTSMFSGLLQKDLFKGRWILAKSYFKQNYCHACHTRFAVFFPLPSCCVSSLLKFEAGRIHFLSDVFVAVAVVVAKAP